MINELDIKQKNFELQQKMMMGFFVEQKNKLNEKEINQLKQDYIGMYYALTAINWGHGMTLGMAWQKALEQMDAFVKAKSKIPNHIVNEQIKKIHSEFRRGMSKTIMLSQYSEEKLNPEYRQHFINYGTKRVKETKKSFDDIYTKYMPKQDAKTTHAKSFDIARQRTQQMMQQLMLQQMMNQRAA